MLSWAKLPDLPTDMGTNFPLKLVVHVPLWSLNQFAKLISQCILWLGTMETPALWDATVYLQPPELPLQDSICG